MNYQLNADDCPQPCGDDAIVYAAELAALTPDYTKGMAHNAIKSQMHVGTQILGLFPIQAFYPNVNSEFWSHDCMIGLKSLSKLRGFDYHNHFYVYDFFRRLQPWWMVYSLFIQDRFLSHLLGLLLLPILSMYMILNCLIVTSNNGVVNTSEQMLIWLALHTVDMPITMRICNFLVSHNKVGSWKGYATIYFGPNHCITQLIS